jgi:hypothetical protein
VDADQIYCHAKGGRSSLSEAQENVETFRSAGEIESSSVISVTVPSSYQQFCLYEACA